MGTVLARLSPLRPRRQRNPQSGRKHKYKEYTAVEIKKAQSRTAHFRHKQIFVRMRQHSNFYCHGMFFLFWVDHSFFSFDFRWGTEPSLFVGPATDVFGNHRLASRNMGTIQKQ
jgi:hypothetical protein